MGWRDDWMDGHRDEFECDAYAADDPWRELGTTETPPPRLAEIGTTMEDGTFVADVDRYVEVDEEDAQ